METSIFDNEGRKYKVVYVEYPDGSFDLEVRYRSQFVGKATSSMRENGSMVLEDIYIRDDSVPRGKSVILNSLGPPSKPLNFRGKGLGTALLQWFINYVRSKGLTQVYGSITKEDLLSRPYLSEWYKKYGFKECAPYQYHVPRAKIFLCLELR